MTTVVDPLGAPSIYYNKSGRTIVRVVASGDSLSTAAPIPHESGDVIALVSVPDGFNTWTVLSSSAEPGDSVAVFVTNNSTINVAVPSGETVGNGGTETNVQSSGGRIFYKVSATEWYTTPY